MDTKPAGMSVKKITDDKWLVVCRVDDHRGCRESIIPGMRWHTWRDSQAFAVATAWWHVNGRVKGDD